MIDPTDTDAINRAVAELQPHSNWVGYGGSDESAGHWINGNSSKVYSPADNIAQAWELVDEMKEHGLYKITIHHHKNIFSYEVELEFDTHLCICESGNEECEAICLAWLKWKKARHE